MSREKLKDASRRKASSFLRDNGGGNLLPILLVRTSNWFTLHLILKPLNLSVWVQGDIVLLEYWEHRKKKSVCTTGWIWSCKLATYSTVFTQSCRAIGIPNDLHTVAASSITDMLNSWRQGLQVKDVLLLSPETHPEAGKGWKVPH